MFPTRPNLFPTTFDSIYATVAPRQYRANTFQVTPMPYLVSYRRVLIDDRYAIKARLKVIEKELQKHPRRGDLRAESVTLSKQLRLLNLKESRKK